MKLTRFLWVTLCLFAVSVQAQDIIVKTNGDILRGTIKATNYTAVKYVLDNGTEVIAGVKDVKQFVWNGETYIIKTFFGKKKPEDRFVKIVETGAVNLYAVGGQTNAAEPEQARVKVRPSVGIGMGSGGMGGGIGGTISIGGGRRNDQPSGPSTSKTFYFIEKPGTGALQEVTLSDTEKTRALLLQKLGDDEDLSGRIKETEEFNGKALVAFVKAYNEMHKGQ